MVCFCEQNVHILEILMMGKWPFCSPARRFFTLDRGVIAGYIAGLIAGGAPSLSLRAPTPPGSRPQIEGFPCIHKSAPLGTRGPIFA